MPCVGSMSTLLGSCPIMSVTSLGPSRIRGPGSLLAVSSSKSWWRPPTLPPPLAHSDGESKVGVSDAELPSPHQIIPKVHQADDVEHTLDKGLWVGTGAMRQGWRIYVGVSACLSLFASAAY